MAGGDLSTAMAYIADVSEPADRGKYFGIVGAVAGLGFILGPSIGGLLAHSSLSLPLYASAGLTLCNFIYGFFFLPESLDKSRRMADFSLNHLNPFIQLRFIFQNEKLKPVMIVGFLYFFAFAQMQGVSSVFLKDVMKFSPSNLGFYFLALGLGDMVTQGYLSGKLLPRFGTSKLVNWGFIITAFAFGINSVLPLFPHVFMTYTYILIYALGSGLFEPAFSGLVSASASASEQGRVMGASQSMQAVTRIAGPLCSASLYQVNYSLPWISSAVFSIAGALLVMNMRKKQNA
jgi:MFS transporter, DHA1 family, tetracycline resistance protein